MPDCVTKNLHVPQFTGLTSAIASFVTFSSNTGAGGDDSDGMSEKDKELLAHAVNIIDFNDPHTDAEDPDIVSYTPSDSSTALAESPGSSSRSESPVRSKLHQLRQFYHPESTDVRIPSRSYSDDSFMDKPEDVMSYLNEEFGAWEEGKEQFVTKISAAIFHVVVIKGALYLTNKRLMFLSHIDMNTDDRVILSGPITVHKSKHRFSKRKRVWFQLRPDRVVYFRSSQELYHPQGTFLLSRVTILRPGPDKFKNSIEITRDTKEVRYLEFDTVETRDEWFTALQRQIYTVKSAGDVLHLDMPLANIVNVNLAPCLIVVNRLLIEARLSETDADEEARSLEIGYFRSNDDFYGQVKTAIADAKASAGAFVTPRLDICAVAGEAAVGSTSTPNEDRHTEKEDVPAKFVRKFALPDDPSSLRIHTNVILFDGYPIRGDVAIARSFFLFWRRTIIGHGYKLQVPLDDIVSVAHTDVLMIIRNGVEVTRKDGKVVTLGFPTGETRNSFIDALNIAIRDRPDVPETTLTNEIRLSDDSARPAAGDGDDPTYSDVITSEPRGISSLSINSETDGHEGGASTDAKSAAETPRTGTPVGVATPSSSSPAPSPRHASTADPDASFGPPSTVPTVTKEELFKPEFLTVARHMPFKVTGLRFVCMAIGSRGDVQPYIALAKALKEDGNHVTIASHPEYREWVEGFGIDYKDVGGDPGALMKLSVEHKMFSPGFFKTTLGQFRTWFDELLRAAWDACQDADVLIESPQTMSGIHISESLRIPYFRAFTMPWTPTEQYPQAFASSADLGPTYNSLSYTLYDTIIWKASSGQVNAWRKRYLKLPPTNISKMRTDEIPFIYNFSAHVCPKPNDWKDHIYLSGYWFLDDDATDPENVWDATPGLLEFIEQAKSDKVPIVYIGFGSIVVSDATDMTNTIIRAVEDAKVRVILSKGWSDRMSTSKTEKVPMPASIFEVSSVSHYHLFPLIDAACHHGGSGTTGASLRAGLPTIIHPFFGDQHFWATRVQKLNVGIRVSTLSQKSLANALIQATTDVAMRRNAQSMGEEIRAEDGPRNALMFIYKHLHLAKTATEDRRAAAMQRTAGSVPGFF